MNKPDIFWQTYLNLEKEFMELSKYIFVTDRIFEKSGKTYKEKIIDSQFNVFPHILPIY